MHIIIEEEQKSGIAEEKLKEVQIYIRYLTFRDEGNVLTEMLTEDAIVEQLTESMKKVIWGQRTPANVVSQRMKEKYVI